MLQPGNTKLGKGIYSWSIPAVFTCPGKSSLCSNLCYAKDGFFRYANVKESHKKNFKASRSKKFAAAMTAAIRRRKARVVRIHVAGDFYSAAYAGKWLEVIRACPDTVFVLYTRSWRKKPILAVIGKIARQPNARVWLSCDREMGPPPRLKRTRRAFMMVTDEDVAPFKVDIVFRDSTSTRMKFDPKGRFVCPVEQGVKRKFHMTCAACQVCIRPDPAPVKEVALCR